MASYAGISLQIRVAASGDLGDDKLSTLASAAALVWNISACCKTRTGPSDGRIFLGVG
jgi:hypothetical protein